MKQRLEGLSFAHSERAEEILLPILRDESIFGVDLEKAGLAQDIICAFKQMNSGAGEVRRGRRHAEPSSAGWPAAGGL